MGHPVTTRFIWEGFRLLQEIRDDGEPLTYLYSDADSYEPLARVDGITTPAIYWFHTAANGTPESLTDKEGQTVWAGVNSAWGKLLSEDTKRFDLPEQNLRMQGQHLDRDKSAGSRFEQRLSAGPEGASLMDEASIRGFTTIYSAAMTRMRGGSRSRIR